MRVVIQRVKQAGVDIAGEQVTRIAHGILVLAGFSRSDTDCELSWMAKKIVSLRIFADDDGKMNLTLQDIGGSILVVSQFTLYGDCRKGKRPSFDKSAPPALAEGLYGTFVEMITQEAPGLVAAGVFREHMQVSLVNDGPVTLIIEKEHGA
ncbi:MAG: D-aminoacyl-tRNA deacylase [Candidatus Latescibacterota bacterium]